MDLYIIKENTEFDHNQFFEYEKLDINELSLIPINRYL